MPFTYGEPRVMVRMSAKVNSVSWPPAKEISLPAFPHEPKWTRPHHGPFISRPNGIGSSRSGCRRYYPDSEGVNPSRGIRDGGKCETSSTQVLATQRDTTDPPKRSKSTRSPEMALHEPVSIRPAGHRGGSPRFRGDVPLLPVGRWHPE